MNATDSLGRFLAPSASPDLVRALAWQRSLVRIVRLGELAPYATDGSRYVDSMLGQMAPDARHCVAGRPDFARYLTDLSDRRESQPAIEISVAANAVALCPRPDDIILDYNQPLSLALLPCGTRHMRAVGRFERPRLIVQEGKARIIDLASDRMLDVGGETPVLAGERADPSQSLTLVDAWKPFGNDFDDGNESVILTTAERREVEAELDGALALLEAAAPGTRAEMVTTARYLSPIRSRSPSSGLPSFSSPAFPGVVFVGVLRSEAVVTDARHLAELCFHEHLHNRLYLLDELQPLTRPTSLAGELYFSPWRRAMRPTLAILHAIYVFARLAWLWRQVEALPVKSALREFATERMLDETGELSDSAAQLQGSQELTPTGRRVLDSSVTLLNGLQREGDPRAS